MLFAGLILSAVLNTHIVLAQCDRAADCSAGDPWWYPCPDGTRSDYTDCANGCCAKMNAGICADPVQGFPYQSCMDACSAAAKARCGTTTKPPGHTTKPHPTKPHPTTTSAASCHMDRGSTCPNRAASKCHGCGKGGKGPLESNGKEITTNGCGQAEDWWERGLQEEFYPLMTKVCNQHDHCFGTCNASFEHCNRALLLGAEGVCDQMKADTLKECGDDMECDKKKGNQKKECEARKATECPPKAEEKYDKCQKVLVHWTKVAIASKRICKAFNDAQEEFCKCAKH